MKIQYIPMFAALALLCSCATQYRAPAAGQPSATLHIKTNHSTTSTSNVFLACADDVCEQNEGGSQLAVFNWANPGEEAVRIAAGERIRIKAIAANALAGVGGPGEVIGSECKNTVSFIPIAGRSYEIRQQLGESHCRIILIDSLSGKAPDSAMN